MLKTNRIQEFLITLWFIVALAHSTNTTLNRYLIYLMWGNLLLTKLIKRDTIAFSGRKGKYFLWWIPFVILGAISSVWALDSNYVFAEVQVLFKIFLGTSILLVYIDSKEKWIRCFNLLIIASIYMMVRIVIFIPSYPIFYQVIQEATDLYFNTVAQTLAFLIIGAFFLGYFTKKKIYFLYMIPAYAMIIYTGSRKSLLIPIIGILIISGISKQSIIKRFGRIIFTVIIGTIGFYFLSKNELLMERLKNLFISLFTDNIVDSSVEERNYYRQLGISMFFQKPILGYGLDNFQVMLMRIGYPHIAYSHNNYTEVGSNLGLVGLITYYWYYLYLLLINFKGFIKKNIVNTFVTIAIILFMIFEYGIVSYGIQIYHIFFVFFSTAYYLNILRSNSSDTYSNK